jgi:hypothetical protein
MTKGDTADIEAEIEYVESLFYSGKITVMQLNSLLAQILAASK